MHDVDNSVTHTVVHASNDTPPPPPDALFHNLLGYRGKKNNGGHRWDE